MGLKKSSSFSYISKHSESYCCKCFHYFPNSSNGFCLLSLATRLVCFGDLLNQPQEEVQNKLSRLNLLEKDSTCCFTHVHFILSIRLFQFKRLLKKHSSQFFEDEAPAPVPAPAPKKKVVKRKVVKKKA